MRILLDNRTRYRDDDLRALLKAACAQAGVAFGKVKVTVTHTRSSACGGYAYFPPRFRVAIAGAMVDGSYLPRSLLGTRTGRMALRLPKPGVTIRDGSVAQVALHEAMHLAGARHRDMTEEQRDCSMPTPWADGLPLREREAAPVAPVEERRAAARSDRLDHARSMLRRAETRSKRAATIQKKWARRVRAMEKP